MIARTTFVHHVSMAEYDRYLAEGWFRDSMMLYSSDNVLLDGRLRTIAHIRIPLETYSMSKSLRKIYRTHHERFRLVVGKPKSTKNRERLYQQHIPSFRGFVHRTMAEIVFPSVPHHFRTVEFSVYDGKKLVAVSYLDVAQHSCASIIGVYDHAYRKESLGTFTMLAEIAWAREQGLKYYYPGYIFDGPSEFDYKLRLGGFETMEEHRQWVPFRGRKQRSTYSDRVHGYMDELKLLLEARGIEPRLRLYPYYTTGMVVQVPDRLLTAPMYYEIADREAVYAACYEPLKHCFMLHRIEPADEYSGMLNMLMSREYASDERYERRLMKITSSAPLFAGHQPAGVHLPMTTPTGQ